MSSEADPAIATSASRRSPAGTAPEAADHPGRQGTGAAETLGLIPGRTEVAECAARLGCGSGDVTATPTAMATATTAVTAVGYTQLRIAAPAGRTGCWSCYPPVLRREWGQSPSPGRRAPPPNDRSPPSRTPPPPASPAAGADRWASPR